MFLARQHGAVLHAAVGQVDDGAGPRVVLDALLVARPVGLDVDLVRDLAVVVVRAGEGDHRLRLGVVDGLARGRDVDVLDADGEPRRRAVEVRVAAVGLPRGERRRADDDGPALEAADDDGDVARGVVGLAEVVAVDVEHGPGRVGRVRVHGRRVRDAEPERRLGEGVPRDEAPHAAGPGDGGDGESYRQGQRRDAPRRLGGFRFVRS